MDKNSFVAHTINLSYQRWIMNAIYTPAKVTSFTDVELYLYQLQEKYKRILVLTCNPNAIVLDDRFIIIKKIE